MSHRSSRAPTEQDAVTIVETVLHRTVQRVQRFPTGLCHFVYDVVADGQPLVVRIAETQGLLGGAVGWSRLLLPLGVPLPALLHADLNPTHVGFPYMVLERLPGSDLGDVYGQLSQADKQTIAAAIVRIQGQVHTLPEGRGFGYATALHEPLPHCTWAGVVEESLARSRQRIAQVGVVDSAIVERVAGRMAPFEAYLSRVSPIAFLDDTTTKNVIVAAGQLSGIVDVDVVCYGDPLWTVGLTQTALLSQGEDLGYITAWSEELGLTEEQRRVVQFYSAVFCVGFLSELGQHFNKELPLPANVKQAERLLRILDELLQGI